MEQYDAEQLDAPMQLSLEGQRSMGSDCGVLSLTIAIGTDKKLSIRLNDLLNRPGGTAGVISIDRTSLKLSLRLPDLHYTLQTWFRQSRDFLVSACILRKAGFAIDDDLPREESAKRTSDEPAGQLDQMGTMTQPSQVLSLTPSTALGLPSQTLPDSTAGPNIFDEVLGRFQRSSTGASHVLDEGVISSQPALSSAKSCRISSVGKGTSIPPVGSPPKIVVSQQQPDSRGQDAASPSSLGSGPPPRRHGHFTRSFSAAAHRKNRGSESIQPAESSAIRGDAGNTGPVTEVKNVAPGMSSSFGWTTQTEFRNLMPRRRKLPFLEEENGPPKRLKQGLGYPPTAQRPVLDEPPSTRSTLTSHGLLSTVPSVAIILGFSSISDKLLLQEKKILCRYEKAIAKGDDADAGADFFFSLLHEARMQFWLGELTKSSAPEDQPVIFV